MRLRVTLNCRQASQSRAQVNSSSATYVLRHVLARPAHRVNAVLSDRVLQDGFGECLGSLVGAVVEECQQSGSTRLPHFLKAHMADMFSNPTANPISISSLRIWFAMLATAIRPEEQNLWGVVGVRVSTLFLPRESGAFRAGSPVDSLYRGSLGDTSSDGRCTSVVGALGREDHSCREASRGTKRAAASASVGGDGRWKGAGRADARESFVSVCSGRLTYANIANKFRVDAKFGDGGFEEGDHEFLDRHVLEGTFASFAHGSTLGESDDDCGEDGGVQP